MFHYDKPNRQTTKFAYTVYRTGLKRNRPPKLMQTKKTIFNFIHLVLSSSNIHGLNHLTAATRHIIEKLIWTVAICWSIYSSTTLGLSAWTRYQENPTVISMDREFREWSTALPAVTLCPTDAVNDSYVDELIQKEFLNYSDAKKNDLKKFLISLVNATYGTFKDVAMVNDGIPPEDYLKYVKLLRGGVTYSVISNNEDVAYSTELVSTVTELGFCYSYNSEISSYNNYKYWMDHNTTIIPGIGIISATPGDGDIFIKVSDFSAGYTGFAHSSYEFPDLTRDKFSSPFGFSKLLQMTALSIYSSPELKYLTPKQRDCMFLDESNLAISPVYTYNLCRIQCRMDQAKKLCGCVPFFYKPLKNYKICDVKGMHCLDQFKEFLIKLRNTTANNTKVHCGCYPSCDDMNYSMEETNFFTKTLLSESLLQWGLSKYPKMRLKRDIIFGFTDVLVSVGGNAGLFLGCSVLSFLELIYFFTFRLIFFFKHNQTE